MVPSRAENVRKAIENLIDAKLHDVLSKPGGLDRLLAHRRTGVASYDIRLAERRLQETLGDVLESSIHDGSPAHNPSSMHDSFHA